VKFRNLREWNEAYRNAAPLVSDAIYDDVEDQVKEAAKALPDGNKLRIEIEEYLAGVGAPVPDSDAVGDGKHWKKAKHKAPAGSLNKAQSDDDVSAWLADCLSKIGVSAVTGIWSDKCDGISILLYYTDGKLVQAVTRGDGEVGEDITRNVLKMKGIVPAIKGFDGDIRGEIVLRKSDHQMHFPTYANPRNAASGIAKRLDGVGAEHLTVLHYRIHRKDGTGRPIPSKTAEFRILGKLGAALPSCGTFDSIEGIRTVYQRYIDSAREGLDYDIDGLVFEFDTPAHMDALGDKNNRPRGAIAYKFPHDQKVSTLRNVRWQVGNTGRLTPVAEFDAVKLAGATVVQASLHNIGNMTRLAGAVGQEYLFAGDTVVVSRRNDVIPYVESVVESDLPEDAAHFEPPLTCPACGEGTVRDGEYLVCPNEDGCPAQVAGAIKAWVKKIGLKGVGTSLIDTLCEQGIISDAADLYTLDAGQLADIRMDGRRVGGTSDTVVTELHGKKDLPLHVFVGSLNINLCSRSTCKTIVDAGFDTLDKMRAATLVEIARIPGMGSGRASAFVGGLENRQAVIDKLLANGVTIQAPADGPLKGQTFCMTGFRDSDMTEAIESAGGTVKSGVSKTLTTLVCKDPKSNSGKAKKARGYGVEVIGQDDMWTRLGGRP
jgi:DNA ligase (NAD+)